MIKALAARRSLLRLASASASSSPFAFSKASFLGGGSVPQRCQVQGFCEAPTSQKEEPVQVPIPVHGVAGKYASALYVTAVRAKALDPVYDELKQIMKAADKSPTFTSFMKDMSLSNKDRVKAVQSLFTELGFSEITVNFLALVSENGRLHGLQEILDCVSDVVMAHKKQVKALVTTVVELKPKELEDLKKSLKRFVKPDETILLDQKIDKQIMGGLMVDIGEKHIDLSIATKLKQMEKILMEPLP